MAPGFLRQLRHIHQSFSDAKTGKSLCYDAKAKDNLTPWFRRFIAGQLDLLCETTLFIAPFVNSYKRFQDDSFAGVTRCWSIDNRTSGRESSTSTPRRHGWNTVSAAPTSPLHRLRSCCSVAGMRGVEKKLRLPAPVDGNAYHVAGLDHVPRSLDEAGGNSGDAQLVRLGIPPV